MQVLRDPFAWKAICAQVALIRGARSTCALRLASGLSSGIDTEYNLIYYRDQHCCEPTFEIQHKAPEEVREIAYCLWTTARPVTCALQPTQSTGRDSSPASSPSPTG